MTEEQYIKDSNDNLRTRAVYKIEDGKLYVSYHYKLELGKSTLKGEHPKLAELPKCSYPKRLSCNYGEGFERCEFMEYDNTLRRWYCSSPNSLDKGQKGSENATNKPNSKAKSK